MKTKFFIVGTLFLFFFSVPFFCKYFKSEVPENQVPVFNGTSYFYDEDKNFEISVYDREKDDVIKTDIFTVISNQILNYNAENYGDETIKALALTIFSDMLYDYKIAKKEEVHPSAFLCTDCLYCNKITTTKTVAKETKNRLFSLIESVITEYVTFKKEPILGAVTPLSSGVTENAKALWGKDIKYLKSVKSEKDIKSKNFENEYSFPLSSFYKKAKMEWGVDGNMKKGISISEKTKTGNVLKINLFGREINGVDFCKKFGIISLNFKVKIKNDKVFIKTKGIGNSLGLSIYGADALEKEGYTYKDIVKYYFSGVSISYINFLDFIK